MKNRYISLILIFLANCTLFGQDAKKNIEQVLDEWHLAAAEANFEAYFSRMTSDAVFIGTDATENWDMESFKEFSKPYFDRGKAWSFKAEERHIYIDDSGQIAWFDELLDTWMGICRGSGVVRFENGSWKVAHYVLSATIPNDDMDEVIRVKKEKDSIQLLELKNRKAPSNE